jgi:hypothetical protein
MSNKTTMENISVLLDSVINMLKEYEQQDTAVCLEESSNEESSNEESSNEESSNEESSNEESSNEESRDELVCEDRHEEDEWYDTVYRKNLTRSWFKHLAREKSDYLSKITFDSNCRGKQMVYIPESLLLTQTTTRKNVSDAIKQQLDARRKNLISGDTYEIYCNRHCFRYFGDDPKYGEVCLACGDKVMFIINSD